MTGNVHISELNTAVLAACNNFRKNMDPLASRNYLLTLFLLKYISDLWKDHQQQYVQNYGKNHERIRRRLSRERFIIPTIEIMDSKNSKVIDCYSADFYSLYKQRNSVDLAEQVNRVINAIENTNSRKLAGVFRDIDFCSQKNMGRNGERNRRLKQLFEDMNRPVFDMRPSEASADMVSNICRFINECFSYELDKKTEAGQPPYMAARLVVQLARPVAGEIICDPVCGEGKLLVAAAQNITNNNYALYGMELNSAYVDIARINMYLHGMDCARIVNCNALSSPALVENNTLMKFDVVLGYLPSTHGEWGQLETENDIYRRFWRGALPASKVEYAIICHMLESADNKHGRVVIIVPHGVLFRGGAEARIRKKIIEENSLDAVIGLPCVFAPATGLPVVALVFDRSREAGGARTQHKDVIFIDASRMFNTKRDQDDGEHRQIENICETFMKRKAVNNYSYLASKEEITHNNYNLNISRYVNDYKPEDDQAPLQIDSKTRALEKEVFQTRSEIMNMFKKLMDDVR